MQPHSPTGMRMVAVMCVIIVCGFGKWVDARKGGDGVALFGDDVDEFVDSLFEKGVEQRVDVAPPLSNRDAVETVTVQDEDDSFISAPSSIIRQEGWVHATRKWVRR